MVCPYPPFFYLTLSIYSIPMLTSLFLSRLAKIKGWIDEHNPGDPLIPFSVALEERLVNMSEEEKKEEETKIGAISALPKITKAGYDSLDVCSFLSVLLYSTCTDKEPDYMRYSLSDTSPVDKSKFVHGRSGEVRRLLKPPVSFSTSFPSSLTAVPYKKTMTPI